MSEFTLGSSDIPFASNVHHFGPGPTGQLLDTLVLPKAWSAPVANTQRLDIRRRPASPENDVLLGHQGKSHLGGFENSEASLKEDDKLEAIKEHVELGISDEPTVQQLINTDPRTACEILECSGKVKLMTFSVKASLVKDLLGTMKCYALGTEEREPEDLEDIWREFLRKKAGLPDEEAVQKLPGSHVDVDAYLVDIPNAAGFAEGGIVQPLLQRRSHRMLGLHIFGLHTVQAVVTFKWMCWAKKYLLLEMANYVFWLLSFQVYAFLFVELDRHPKIGPLASTPVGIAARIFGIVPLIGMAPFVYVDVAMFLDYGFKAWASTWNTLDVIAYLLQIYTSIWSAFWLYDLGRNQYRAACSLQILLLWVKVQYFARVLQPNGNPFVETIRESVKYVKWFIVLLFFLLWGFASAFYILFGLYHKDYSDIGRSLYSTWNIASGRIDSELLFDNSNKVMANLIMFLCFFSTSLILLKILVGLLSFCAISLAENSTALFIHGRAQLIDEMEIVLPAWLRNRHPEWYPRYVQYIQVNQDSARYMLPITEKLKVKTDEKVDSFKGTNLETANSAMEGELLEAGAADSVHRKASKLETKDSGDVDKVPAAQRSDGKPPKVQFGPADIEKGAREKPGIPVGDGGGSTENQPPVSDLLLQNRQLMKQVASLQSEVRGLRLVFRSELASISQLLQQQLAKQPSWNF
eukprot:jgi/Botrbrau1/7578/Bobra.0159s0027.1